MYALQYVSVQDRFREIVFKILTLLCTVIGKVTKTALSLNSLTCKWIHVVCIVIKVLKLLEHCPAPCRNAQHIDASIYLKNKLFIGRKTLFCPPNKNAQCCFLNICLWYRFSTSYITLEFFFHDCKKIITQKNIISFTSWKLST